MSAAVAWHDAQQGGYTLDLPVWRELATGRVLELGSGTGRVSIDLAAHGHDVTALDTDSRLLAELQRRARRAGVDVSTVCMDAAMLPTSPLAAHFETILAPASFIQIVPDPGRVLAACAARLDVDGVLALDITDLDELANLNVPGHPHTVADGRRRYQAWVEAVDVDGDNVTCRWGRILKTLPRTHGRQRRPPALKDVLLAELPVTYRDFDPAWLEHAGLQIIDTQRVTGSGGFVAGTVYIAAHSEKTFS